MSKVDFTFCKVGYSSTYQIKMANIKSLLKIQNKINVLRAEKRMTQQQLADAVGVTRATINAIEKGNYNPTLELAFRLSNFFQTSIHSIFKVENENESI